MIAVAEQPSPQPYVGYEVYYSGAISAGNEPDQQLPVDLVQYMQRFGAKVLSEHVAYARDKMEMWGIQARNLNTTVAAIQHMAKHEPNEFAQFIRRNDVRWVDACTHFVAMVNQPSFGIGMEIERCLSRGQVPMLLLCRANLLPNLSRMVMGVNQQFHPCYHIEGYTTPEEAITHLTQFLNRYPLKG